MRDFRMFFGIAIGVILLMFVARIAIVAFVFAAIASIIYAIFRRVKDFITYDRYGQPYHRGYSQASMNNYRNYGMESFYNDYYRRGAPEQTVQVVEVK